MATAQGDNENLIKNPGFEEGLKDWTFDERHGKYQTAIVKDAYRGQYSAYMKSIIPGWARFLQIVKVEKGKTYTVSVMMKGRGSVLLSVWRAKSNHEEISLPLTDNWQKVSLNFTAYKSGNISIIHPKGKFVLDRRDKTPDPALLQTLSKKYLNKGFIAFQRNNVRFLYQKSIPQKEEVIEKTMCLTGAMEQPFCSGVVAVHALKNIKALSVKVNDLVGQNHIIESKDITVKMVTVWQQRTRWNSSAYYEIPELLEAAKPVSLQKGSNQGYVLHVDLPKNLAEGTYTGRLSIVADNAPEMEIALSLKILPFKLKKVTADWILYVDDYRWNKMTDSELEKELLFLHKSGITGIISSAYRDGFKLKKDQQDNIIIDYPRILRFQKIRKKLGILNGPLVIAIEKYLESKVGKLLGINVAGRSKELSGQMKNNVLIKGFKDALRSLDKLIKQSGGPGYSNWFYYGTDEPHSNGYLNKALWEYENAGKAGVKTACACYPRKAVAKLLPYLSADIVAVSATDKAANDLRLSELKQGNCEYWYRGAGCYTGQEGGLMPNRYMAGLLFYKTGASAHVSWTYQRCKGNGFDDFDSSRGERKDACMTYPDRKNITSGIPTETLQWLGLKEGVIDYRYVYTLKSFIKKARSKNRKRLADQAEKRLTAILEEVPWYGAYIQGNSYSKPGNFTNQSADIIRMKIAKEIIKLKILMFPMQ
jgi:hypothetical protein